MDQEILKKYDIVIITGPTASGKTSFAASLAQHLKGEIVSADSRQVYRGMDIGTGKDYNDYIIEGNTIPCHLIDIADPGYKYNVFEYQRDFFKVYKSLKAKNVFPIVCGGSGMYVDSIITGYKMIEVPPDTGLRKRLEEKPVAELNGILAAMKNLHNTTDTDSKKRVIRAIEIEHYNKNRKAHISRIPKLNSLVIGLKLDRDIRRENISRRLHQRLETGLVEEVKGLICSGVAADILIYYGLEYKYITHYLMGKLNYDKMVTDLEIAIHQFAKRQMTWFRSMEKKGTKIHWIDGKLPMDEKVDLVLDLLSRDKHTFTQTP